MILVISGIVALTRRQYLWGIVLIIVGFLVGPGWASHLHVAGTAGARLRP